MTPEEYIKAYTRGCSNELVGGGYHEWLTPENALAAVELARKEMKEPASEDLEQASEEYAYTNWESDDYHEGASEGKPFDAIGHTQKCFIDGAQWQKEQMMKDAIEGQVERGYYEDGISEHFEVFAYLSGRDKRFKDLSDGQSVKVIIIKE